MKTRPLRNRVFVVVVLVVLAPLALVLIAQGIGAREADEMRAAVETALTTTEPMLRRTDSPVGTMEDAAKAGRLRLVVLDQNDELVLARDHDGDRTLRDRIGDAMFGPNGAPDLHAYDRSRGAPADWDEVRAARRDGSTSGCEVVLSGGLSICYAAARTPSGQVILAQKTSPRAIRALADLRYALLKLTLITLALAFALALWLSRRIALPVERLRDAVLRRTAQPHESGPIPVVSKDEVGELGRAFNSLVDTLQSRNRSNVAFAADLAHQLKSPILAIRASLDSLKPGISKERLQRIQGIIQDSTKRLDTVVSRLLELARAEGGLTEAQREKASLVDIVRGVRDGFARDERYEGVSFEIETPSHADAVVAPAAVEEAIRNLFDNAASFAQTKDPSWVRARLSVDEERIELRITDSGPGIPDENLPKVFERFFTERPDGRGTGLGLAYTKAVFEAHGGGAEVHNTTDAGACFVVWLPMTPSPAGEEGTPS